MGRDLSSLQRTIVEWRYDNPTASLQACAKALGCSYSAVRNTKKSPLCKALYDDLVLMEQSAKVLSRREKRELLATVARAELTQFIGQDGKITLSPDNPNRAAVAEFEVSQDSVGKKVVRERRKIKLVDRLEAIDLDNKMENLYNDKPQLNVNVGVVIKEVEVRLSGIDTSKALPGDNAGG